MQLYRDIPQSTSQPNLWGQSQTSHISTDSLALDIHFDRITLHNKTWTKLNHTWMCIRRTFHPPSHTAHMGRPLVEWYPTRIISSHHLFYRPVLTAILRPQAHILIRILMALLRRHNLHLIQLAARSRRKYFPCQVSSLLVWFKTHLYLIVVFWIFSHDQPYSNASWIRWRCKPIATASGPWRFGPDLSTWGEATSNSNSVGRWRQSVLSGRGQGCMRSAPWRYIYIFCPSLTC